MTKGNKWFVTRKPSSEFQLYDFARSARQAKDMLESIADGSPIAHRSKSEGGLYNIYVKKGSVYALEKGGMIEVGDKVRAVRDGVGAFSIGKGQTGIVEEITSGGRGVIIELTNGSRRETLIEDIEKHNFRMYAEGGEIYSGGVNILKNLIDRDLIKDKNGDHYYEAEDAITDNDEKASFYALKNLWDNSLIKDESGDHFEEVTEYVGKARRHSASSYAEGGEIARKMLLQNKGVKEVIRKETVNEIRGAIEKEGYNTKGVTDDEILMIHKELQSSFYAEGGEISEEQIDEINELIAEFMRPINVDTEAWGFLKMARYDAETVNEKLEYISDARFKINVTDPMWQNLVGLQREIEEISSGSSYAEGGETKGKKKFVFSNIKGEVVSDLTLSKQESIAKETSDSLGKGFSVDKDSVGEGHFNLYLDLGNNDKYADLSGGGGEFVIMKDGRVINQGRSGLPIAYNWKTKKSYAEGGNVKSEDYWHLKTQLQKNESILEEGGFHSTQRAEELHGEIQRLKNELKKYEDSGSTYEEGGNIKGSYFEGELSFLNW